MNGTNNISDEMEIAINELTFCEKEFTEIWRSKNKLRQAQLKWYDFQISELYSDYFRKYKRDIYEDRSKLIDMELF